MPTEGRIPDISEDDYFFEMLEVEKRLSEDPNTQMSACIVNEDKSVIILGHNHSPNGFSNMPWGKTEENELDTKYPYVIHAELDAITKAIKNGITTAGKKMYILNYPCNKTLLLRHLFRRHPLFGSHCNHHNFFHNYYFYLIRIYIFDNSIRNRKEIAHYSFEVY